MKVTDPVCGKTIELEAAEPVEHGGWAYFFCSAACRNAFLAAPDRYAPSRHERSPPHREAVSAYAMIPQKTHSCLRKRTDVHSTQGK